MNGALQEVFSTMKREIIYEECILRERIIELGGRFFLFIFGFFFYCIKCAGKILTSLNSLLDRRFHLNGHLRKVFSLKISSIPARSQFHRYLSTVQIRNRAVVQKEK